MNLKPNVSKGVLSYVVSNAGLGISEYYHLETLYKISVVISIFSSSANAVNVECVPNSTNSKQINFFIMCNFFRFNNITKLHN